jgi:DEAD/DEAH box helicase domain-containing protein
MRNRPAVAGVGEILEALKSTPGIGRNITHWHEIPEDPGRLVDFPSVVSQELLRVLQARGIRKLYSHQAEAITSILKGEHVVVVTPTASGKTLCYDIPVVESILADEQARSLYLFPTKALSQDQYANLYETTHALGRNIKVYTFDGDTPQSARRAIRSAGQIVVTNPDMLHTGILPHHTLWIRLFENLKYVVIDEIHHYRGVFGSHLANVLRRLRRICRFYNAKPVFICCSATIANPRELAEKLVEVPFRLVDTNGAPRGKKLFVFYNPPLINRELGIRKSLSAETRRLATRFLARDVQSIVFARSRLRVEILVTYLKRAAGKIKKSPDRIRGYRGGYLPTERRAIEKGLRDGEVLGVVSTNALELGIDIGQLKVAILSGYPGTVASTWQQAGRAGRKTDTSAAILIASSAPLDQYIINHPDYFFGASPEMGIINPDNVAILASHIKCGAFELPFEDGEQFGGANPLPLLQHLEKENILRHTGGRWYWASEAYPAEDISLRSATVENFVILNTAEKNEVIGEVDHDSAPFLIHKDAIYIHQSQTFFIERLDWEGRTAYAKPVTVDYYTDALAKTDIKVLTVDTSYQYAVDKERWEVRGLAEIDYPLVSKNFGSVSVVTIVAKYKKIKFETHENVGYGEIHLPQQEMQTESYWLTFRDNLGEDIKRAGGDLGGGLRALANLLLNVVPLFVMCDPRDIATVPMVRAPHDPDQHPAIYIYDKYPGGIGISRKLFTIDEQIMRAAREMLAECKCKEGCPSCVGPALEVGDLGKQTAGMLLAQILKP